MPLYPSYIVQATNDDAVSPFGILLALQVLGLLRYVLFHEVSKGTQLAGRSSAVHHFDAPCSIE
jgi:hypothetical protein